MDTNIQQPPIQETTPPTFPLEPQKAFGWLKWVLIGLFIAILSSGATYFVMNQSQQNQQPVQTVQSIPTLTPDPTANWKTYTSPKYGYSIKYPPTWSEQVKCAGGLPEDDYICFLSPDFESLPPGFVMGSTTKGGVLEIDGKGDLVGSPVKDFCAPNDLQSFSDCRKIFVNGVNAMKRRWLDTTQIGIPDLSNETFILSFRIVYNERSEKDILQVIDQILSTFKFTE